MTNVSDCKIVKLPTASDARGSATFLVENKEVPFNIRRTYYLYNVPSGKSRGAHAHKWEKQMVVVLGGSADVILDDGKRKRKVRLSDPTKGLYIAPMIWREFKHFSKGAVLLAVVDDFLDQKEYIRDYEEFKKAAARSRKKR